MLYVLRKNKNTLFTNIYIMFTLLRNYKALFMMCVENYLEGPAANYDTNRDGDISAQEAKNLLSEKQDAMRAVETAEVETLEAATELAKNIDLSDGLDKMEQKTIQYLASKILKLQGKDVADGSIDGNIGNNSITDINEATQLQLQDKSKITLNVISQLNNIATSLVATKKQEFVNAEAAEQVERDNAEALLSQYADVDAIEALDTDRKKEVQTALKTLGYYTKAIDGDFGRGSKAAYKEYQAAAAEAARTPEEIQAQENVAHAKAAIDAMKKEHGRKAIRAIQQAYIDANYDLGSTGTDGAPGKLTMAAVEADPSIALTAIADYIDTTDNERVAKRVESEKPKAAGEIDTALEAWMA